MKPSLKASLYVLALLCAFASHAAERAFPFTWTTATLKANGDDVEAWVTPRIAKATEDYLRNDVRFVWTHGWLSSLETQFSGDFSFESTNESMSFEPRVTGLVVWAPLRKSDFANIATIVRASGNTDLFEAEARIAIDRQLGDFLIAANVTAMHTSFHKRGDAVDFRVEESLGLSYRVGPAVSAGIEAMARSAYKSFKYDGTAFYVGPNVTLRVNRFWLSLGLTAQVAADRSPLERDSNEPLELRDNERFMGRIVWGIHTN